MKHLKNRIVPALFTLAVIALSGCGGNKDSTTSTSSASGGQPQVQGNPAPADHTELKFQDFGVIREFGGTDNAALFGLLPETGGVQISKVTGPAFIKAYRVGTLTEATAAKLFATSAKPLSDPERRDLLARYKGASVIYTEGYAGNLCNRDETQYEITATGIYNQTNVTITFQFEALPNAAGNCEFHTFATATRYQN